MIGLIIRWNTPSWYWAKRHWFLSFPIRMSEEYCTVGLTVVGITAAIEWNWA